MLVIILAAETLKDSVDDSAALAETERLVMLVPSVVMAWFTVVSIADIAENVLSVFACILSMLDVSATIDACKSVMDDLKPSVSATTATSICTAPALSDDMVCSLITFPNQR